MIKRNAGVPYMKCNDNTAQLREGQANNNQEVQVNSM